MGAQEELGQGEAGPDLVPAWRGAGLAVQEGRQREQTLHIGRAGAGADRAPALRRHEGEVVALAGRGAFEEIETEAELGEKRELEAHEQRRRSADVVEM